MSGDRGAAEFWLEFTASQSFELSVGASSKSTFWSLSAKLSVADPFEGLKLRWGRAMGLDRTNGSAEVSLLELVVLLTVVDWLRRLERFESSELAELAELDADSREIVDGPDWRLLSLRDR